MTPFFNFAKNMKIKTIAEFVHSKNVFMKVNELEVDFSQGYYFGEPTEDVI
ncbi:MULTISPECIES: EAL domain-containing protein [unclassified Sulfurimonas]|uniref:EAL domain-containing protein n=1 Tax=unclassified Sulfurimonas TaxID=2623549 RepID=UPI0025FA2EA1|nr:MULTISPECIES: EAL domain-containing protein [unclassified Sulfurimonas]